MDIDATSQPAATRPAGRPGGEVSLAEGAGLLAGLWDALRRMQRATAEAVDLAGRVQRAGVVEVCAGINRHGGEDERASHRRASDPR